jgi:hypothetical protein
VSVVLLVVAAAILVGAIAVALGRGGEMTEFSADVRPLDTDIATAADVALLRPQGALWGYDKRSTDEALNLVARTVTERDVEIARLRRQIADLQWTNQKPAQASQEALSAADSGRPDGGQAATQPDQTAPGSPTAPFIRREASPSPPPGETDPWSAWERPAPVTPSDQDETTEPGEARG